MARFEVAVPSLHVTLVMPALNARSTVVHFVLYVVLGMYELCTACFDFKQLLITTLLLYLHCVSVTLCECFMVAEVCCLAVLFLVMFLLVYQSVALGWSAICFSSLE